LWHQDPPRTCAARAATIAKVERVCQSTRIKSNNISTKSLGHKARAGVRWPQSTPLPPSGTAAGVGEAGLVPAGADSVLHTGAYGSTDGPSQPQAAIHRRRRAIRGPPRAA